MNSKQQDIERLTVDLKKRDGALSEVQQERDSLKNEVCTFNLDLIFFVCDLVG